VGKRQSPTRDPDASRAGRSRQSAFTFPQFRRYFFAICLSTSGTWVTRFLLGWSAWDLTHSALWVGIASAALLLPTFLLSPLFGVVSDRVRPRNGLLITLSSQALLVALAALASAGGWFNLGLLLTLAAAAGAVSAAHQPLRLALIPQLVGRDALPGAIGISAIVFNLSRILGPAGGAFLLSTSTAALAFGAAAALFAGAAFGMLLVRGSSPAHHSGDGPLIEELLAGLRFVSETPAIRLILLLTLINGLLGRSVIELLPAVSGILLGGTAADLATLTAAAGAGSILGGLLLTRLNSSEPTLIRLVLASLTLAALVLLPLAWARSLVGLSSVMAILSLATTLAGTGSQALAQLVVTDAYRGRVLSLWTVLTMGAPAIGGFLIGALADTLSMTWVFPACALVALVTLTGLWRRARHLDMRSA
jgi:MFS family permease